jgi:glutathione synthase/RimK-type ligase-like ATP-grasp enzyme
MINTLIPTKPDDTHALFVKLALEQLNHQAVLWYTADYPECQTHAFSLNEDRVMWEANGLDFHVDHRNQFDVVWLRRPRKPLMPSYLHQDDLQNAENENLEFFKTFWQVIAPDAYWINPVSKIRAATSKLVQLKTAREVGMNVPDSLFTNDPEKIRKFIQRYSAGGVIYKPIYPVYWFDEDYVRLTYTNDISEAILPSNPVLQATPGIYQKKIEKAFELRVTYFGEYYLAAKLYSQEHPMAKNDWRTVSCMEMKIEPYTLPPRVDFLCRKFMKKMGLVFGSFDLIVTPHNETIFLELNEQGQFLWVEEVNPDIKMLDAFTSFIIRAGGERRERMQARLSLQQFRKEVLDMQQEAIRIHKSHPYMI